MVEVSGLIKLYKFNYFFVVNYFQSQFNLMWLIKHRNINNSLFGIRCHAFSNFKET